MEQSLGCQRHCGKIRPGLHLAAILAFLQVSVSVAAGPAPGNTAGRQPEAQGPSAFAHPSPGHRDSSRATALSLDRAVALALARHPSIRAASAAVHSAAAQRREVAGTWHPRVKLQVGYMFRGPLQQLSIDQQMDTPMGPIDVQFAQNLGSYNNFNATLQAGWRAWDWGLRSLAAKAADRGLDAAREGRKEVRASLAYAVRTTYLALVFSRRMADVARFGVLLARRRLADETARTRAGLAKELDLMRARSTLASRKAGLESARQQVHKLTLILGLLCGLSGRVQASDRLDRLAGRPIPSVRRLDIVPSVRRMRLVADARQMSARMELRRRWPTVDLTAGASLLYPKNFFEKKWGPAYWAGVVLTWTIWDGMSHDRAAAKARAEAAKSLRLADAETRKIRQELAADRADWRAAASELAAARQRRDAAAAYLRAAKAAVTAGTAKPLDVLAAEQALLGAQVSVAKARFQRAMARAGLLFHLGIALDPLAKRTASQGAGRIRP